MVTRTWETVERPILEAVAAAEEDGVDMITGGEVIERTGLDENAVDRALVRLTSAAYLDGAATTGGPYGDWFDLHLTEKGLRRVGVWPADDAFAEVLRVLEERLAAEQDPEQRTRLEQARDAVKALGGQVVSSIVVEAAKRLAGL